MRGKALLLGSVSSLATMAVAVGEVHAQTVPPPASNGFTYSVQGGALFSAPDSVLDDKAGEKAGASFSGSAGAIAMPEDIGYNGAFSIGKQLDAGWDIAFGAGLYSLQDNTDSVSASGLNTYSGVEFSGATEETTNFSFQTGDFEVGYTPQLDQGYKVRLSGGIRALHMDTGDALDGTETFRDKIGGSGAGIEGGYEGYSADFVGAGPRLAVSGSKRLEGLPFGLSGSLGVAAEYGRETEDKVGGGSIYQSSGGVGSGGTTYTVPPIKEVVQENRWILDVDASVGADYYLNDSTALTVGYHAEQLTDVDGTYMNADGKSKLVQGPFLKLSGSL